jgi:hypothetical protein
VHPLFTEDIARTVVASREAEAARYRLTSSLSRSHRVRRIVGHAFVAAGQRMLGV